MREVKTVIIFDKVLFIVPPAKAPKTDFYEPDPLFVKLYCLN